MVEVVLGCETKNRYHIFDSQVFTSSFLAVEKRSCNKQPISLTRVFNIIVVILLIIIIDHFCDSELDGLMVQERELFRAKEDTDWCTRSSFLTTTINTTTNTTMTTTMNTIMNTTMNITMNTTMNTTMIINIPMMADNAVGKRDQWNCRLWTQQEERLTQILIISTVSIAIDMIMILIVN